MIRPTSILRAFSALLIFSALASAQEPASGANANSPAHSHASAPSAATASGQPAAPQSAELEYTDVESALETVLRDPSDFHSRAFSYQEVSEYYQKSFTALAALFPQGLITPDIPAALAPFSGALKLTSFDVHFVPFMAVAPEDTYDLRDLRFSTIKATIAGRTVPGLRIQTSLDPNRHGLAKNTMITYEVVMSYMAGVNGRALGFSHAQLIPSLSRGVTAADWFEYNGQKSWEKHSRNRKDDQLQRPVALTNHAHESGGTYDISAHPDFSLIAKFMYDRPVLMTFYLWKPRAKLLWLRAAPIPGSPPDFIYQLEIHRNAAPKRSTP